MSHTKIAPKILEVIRQIPNEQSFAKLNEVLMAQKLIPQTRYRFDESREHITRDGVVLQIVTVACELTIIDTESDEELTYTALGSGVNTGSLAIVKAQEMAFNRACIGVLNISSTVVVTEPEIIVETPESKLIAQVTALWRWDPALFNDYFMKRFQRPIEQLNITELSVVKSEFENYGR